MMRARTASVEADIAALKAAAERAGRAMACLFSSSDEFEADLIRERRAQGAFTPKPSRVAHIVRMAILAALTAAFLML